MTGSGNVPYFNEAPIGQQNRLIKLTTPLGVDVLVPQRVLAQERLSKGYEYTIDCLATRDDLELKKLIAQPVTLWVQQAARSYLPIHGYVHMINASAVMGNLLFASFRLRHGCIS